MNASLALTRADTRGMAVAVFADETEEALYRLVNWAVCAIDGKTYTRGKPRIAWTFNRPDGPPWQRMTLFPRYVRSDADDDPLLRCKSNFRFNNSLDIFAILPVENALFAGCRAV